MWSPDIHTCLIYSDSSESNCSWGLTRNLVASSKHTYIGGTLVMRADRHGQDGYSIGHHSWFSVGESLPFTNMEKKSYMY
mgnify:CR=1 FL=1